MHYSGILVVTDPGRMNDCEAQIDALAGVEVRLRYPDEDRMILVQTSETAEEQEQGLRAIRAIPGIQLANPVYVMGSENGDIPDFDAASKSGMSPFSPEEIP